MLLSRLMKKTLGSALGAALCLALFSPACRSTKAGEAKRAPTPTATATPRPAPAVPPGTLPPGATPLPVATPSSPSRYDRAPGVLYEEARTPPPTSAVPTPRPPRPSPTPTPN